MADLDRWRRAFETLMRRALTLAGPNEKVPIADEVFDLLRRKDCDDWTDDIMLREVVPHLLKDWPEAMSRARNPRATVVKMLHLSWCVAQGALNEVEPGERDFIRDAFANFPSLVAFPEVRKPVDPPGEGPLLASVDVVWRWTNRAGRMGPQVKTRIEVAIARIPEDSAPTLLRLRVGDSDAWLDVRSVGSHWFRPVLAPGAWQPVRIGEALDAWALGRPWADDPLSPLQNGLWPEGAVLGLSELFPSAHPGRPMERTAFEIAERALQDRAAGLIVVGDTLYAKTEKPRLDAITVATMGSGPQAMKVVERELRLAWDCESLSQWQEMRTFASRPNRSFIHGALPHLPSSLPPVEACAETMAFVDAYQSEIGHAPERFDCIQGQEPDSHAGAAWLLRVIDDVMRRERTNLSFVPRITDKDTTAQKIRNWKQKWVMEASVTDQIRQTLIDEGEGLDAAMSRLKLMEATVRAAGSTYDDMTGHMRISALAAIIALRQTLPIVRLAEDERAMDSAFEVL